MPSSVAAYLEPFRDASRVNTALKFIPLRFVEARCRLAGTQVAMVFEPTLPIFGSIKTYAIGQFAPASCVLDCVGAIVGIGAAEYQRDWANTTEPCP